MAFRELTGSAVDIKKSPGQPYVGRYQDSREFETELGKQFIYNFVAPDNKPFGIYGFTHLNKIMPGVAPGTLCRITYLGKQKKKTKKFGERDVNVVRVEIDDGSGESVVDESPFNE